jgi:ABC-type bacteriocin/lantibiotic exporter with double-glycine peptidase domain
MKDINFFYLFKLLKKERWLLGAQCFLGLLESLSTIILISQIAALTDSVSNHDYKEFLKILPIAFLIIIVQVLSFYFKRYLGVKCKARFSNDIRNLTAQGIIHTSLELKEKQPSAGIISLFNNQIELIQDIVDIITCIVINPVIAVIACIYFAGISYKLLIFSCIMVPISTIIYNHLSKPIQKKTKEIMDTKAALNIIAKDVLAGFYVMKTFGLQHYFSNKYFSKADTIAHKEKEKDKINSILGRIFIMLRYIPQLIIPLYGGYLSFANEITLGQLIAVNSIIWYIVLPIEELLDTRKKSRIIKPALEDIYHIIDLKPETNTQIHFEEANDEVKELEINSLAYTYEDGTNALKNVNLQVSRKDQIKITGVSGGGKSTLLKIICGLYTGFSGSIRVRGIQFAPENMIEARKLISYVPQHPYLFQDTIEKNISMGKDISWQSMIEAAKLADADEFITELPDGYNTIIGSGGVKLSGGQCKRLAIARAFIKEGAIFIFDEPTSSLDIQTEERLNKGLYKVCKDKCSITVTHKEGTIAQGDKVMTLSEGCLYEG